MGSSIRCGWLLPAVGLLAAACTTDVADGGDAADRQACAACADACPRANGGDGPDGSGAGGSHDTAGDGGAGVEAGPDASNAYALTVSQPTLHPGGSTTFTASVVDPDGPDHIVAVVLRDDGGERHGSFEVEHGSTYALTLSWAQLHASRAIDAPPGGTTLDFVAEFEDASGLVGSAVTTLQLACPSAGEAICVGACVDLQSNAEHCGACGVSADNGHLCADGQLTCAAGQMSCEGTCRETLRACGSCGNDCGGLIDAINGSAATTGVGALDSDRACVEGSCYVNAIRFNEIPASCAQICGAVDLQCIQLRDHNSFVGVASYNGVLRYLAGCSTVPSHSAPIPDDPNDPPAAYLLSNVRCGCQQRP